MTQFYVTNRMITDIGFNYKILEIEIILTFKNIVESNIVMFGFLKIKKLIVMEDMTLSCYKFVSRLYLKISCEEIQLVKHFSSRKIMIDTFNTPFRKKIFCRKINNLSNV